MSADVDTISSAPKQGGYYKSVRKDVFPLLSPRPSRILDIGCAEGWTAAYLKEQGFCDWVGGLEPVAEIKTADRLDLALTCPLETALDQNLLPQVDTILCLDVLEHLVDPWMAVRRLADLLPKGGSLIASIPNIRHYKLVLNLLFKGNFRYQPYGILDSTHLRFFTRETAVELLEQAGLKVTLVQPQPALKPWKNKWIINKLLGGRMTDLYPIIFHLRAEKV
jgi:2-polyprenyl-3-methyl-5-hydroxy-6-metoxy-1,4-benzoquinol methylase